VFEKPNFWGLQLVFTQKLSEFPVYGHWLSLRCNYGNIFPYSRHSSLDLSLSFPWKTKVLSKRLKETSWRFEISVYRLVLVATSVLRVHSNQTLIRNSTEFRSSFPRSSKKSYHLQSSQPFVSQ
jgi:hypothetical protein